jgi:D-3-phosphoglycerate dehydrogenase / 2-oxoglutarate reductase
MGHRADGAGEALVKPFVALVTAMHLSPEAQKILTDAGGEIGYMPDPVDEETLIARFAQGPVQAVVLRGSKPFTARVLGAAPHLKVIAKNGAGVDSVDIECATQHGVAVMVAAGANAEAVAEHSIALMLVLARDLFGLDRKVRGGGWEGTGYQGRDFRASTVGIIGFGSIGRATARMAAALGAKVIVMDAFAKSEEFEMETDLDRLLARVDIVSLHCPLTVSTHGLIGGRQLGLMKKGAILINTARGPLVDEAALIDALRNGQLAGAGLDTFEKEPIATGNPLLQMPNVILTPHVAGVTRNAVLGVATMTATNIVDCINGRPLDRRNLVNPEVLNKLSLVGG